MAPAALSVTDAAKALGVSRWTVYRLIAAKDLPAADVAPTGSKRPKTRVPAEAIAAFLAARTRT